MKTIPFTEWWKSNKGKIEGILWILPKKWREAVKTAIAYIDYTVGLNSSVNRSLDGRDVLPCVRVNPDGSTTIIKCK
jgi:hypothetical protein